MCVYLYAGDPDWLVDSVTVGILFVRQISLLCFENVTPNSIQKFCNVTLTCLLVNIGTSQKIYKTYSE